MWSQFYDEVGTKMKQADWKSSNEWANYFSKKYDECIKRGFDNTTKNIIKKGNVELMNAFLQSASATALAATTPSFYSSYITLLGTAVVGYWTGAELQTVSIPVFPAPGTILNLSVTSNAVTTPGKFADGYTPPIKNVDEFLKLFISLAQIHLTTIQGVCYTISQYPPPLPPAPGVISWTGYKVEMGQLNSNQEAAPFETNNADFKLTEDEKIGAENDIKKAEETVIETYEKQQANEITEQEAVVIVTSANEARSLAKEKLATGMNVSITADPSALNNIQQSTADDDIGKRIIAYAKAAASIPVMETPPPSNYGGYVTTYLNGVGINFPAFWCAAAVSYWFKQAGAKSPNSAGCADWKQWAIRNGLWSSTPVHGAAIIYTDKTGHPHHIGIVADPKPNEQGRITSIEGNTTGGGFNRDGVGVFVKYPRLSAINGFIIPKKK